MKTKKVILILTLFCLSFFLVFQTALAQTPEEGQTEQEKIEDLKERVATKVAQLRSQVYKALLGEIVSVDKESLVLKTAQGEKKILLTEEITILKISRGRGTSLSLANIKVGERVAVIGSADAEGEFVAKIILVKTLPLNINGVIENIDQENFVVTVKNNQRGITYLVEVETTTKIQTWDKEGGVKKSGFSKLQVGDRVHVNGLAVSGETNRLSAVRILALPGRAAGITGVTPTPTPKTSPSPKASLSPESTTLTPP